MDVRGYRDLDGKSRGSRWSVTINLKSVSRSTAEECISRARQLGWRVYGQLEQGESGTEHFQLALSTPQVRFSAVKKVFPTAHIEPARDWNALLSYCQKEETRVESIKVVESVFVTFKSVRDKFFEWFCENSFSVGDDDRERLDCWDHFIGLSIQDGMEVDMIGVNPQYRSAIVRYWTYYVNRHTCRQTDRQTEENVVVPTL